MITNKILVFCVSVDMLVSQANRLFGHQTPVERKARMKNIISKPSPEHIATVFGCTIDQARAGLRSSAVAIRRLSKRDLERWGKTRSQANAIAGDYERRADR